MSEAEHESDVYERVRGVHDAIRLAADAEDPETLERAGWLLVGLSRQARDVAPPEPALEVLEDDE